MVVDNLGNNFKTQGDVCKHWNISRTTVIESLKLG